MPAISGLQLSSSLQASSEPSCGTGIVSDGSKDTSQPPAKRIVSDRSKDASQPPAKRIVSDGSKDTSQPPAKRIVSDGSKDASQPPAKRIVSDGSKDASQPPAKRIVSDGSKDASQPPAKRIVSDGSKDASQPPAKRIVSDGSKDASQPPAKRIVSDGSKDASQPPAKRIKQEKDREAKDVVSLNTVEQCCTLASKEKSVRQKEKLFPQEAKDHESDPNLIQIVASKKELDRRIAAFQQRKREELDVFNVQEFCNLAGGTSSLNSCARTSAVVLRSKGSNSHLKMTHVVNDWGPQTLGLDPGSLSPNFNASKEALKQERGCDNSNDSSRESSVYSGHHSAKDTLRDSKLKQSYEDTRDPDIIPAGIEERLYNLESHLRLAHGAPIPRDVYARIKAVEDRVLHLEGISPEYFRHKKIQAPANTSRKIEIKAVEDDLSLEELEMKIHQIKMKLKQKQLNHVL